MTYVWPFWALRTVPPNTETFFALFMTLLEKQLLARFIGPKTKIVEKQVCLEIIKQPPLQQALRYITIYSIYFPNFGLIISGVHVQVEKRNDSPLHKTQNLVISLSYSAEDDKGLY